MNSESPLFFALGLIIIAVIANAFQTPFVWDVFDLVQGIIALLLATLIWSIFDV